MGMSHMSTQRRQAQRRSPPSFIEDVDAWHRLPGHGQKIHRKNIGNGGLVVFYGILWDLWDIPSGNDNQFANWKMTIEIVD